HFARETDELAVAQRTRSLQRNFQGYSTRAGADILAFGMSSISQTPDHFRQNEKELAAYYRRLDAGELPVSRARFLSEDDRIRRGLFTRRMCDLDVDFDALGRRLGRDLRHYFARELGALAGPAADGLVELTDKGFAVTDTGRLLIRNLAMTFDAYL